MRSSPGTLDPHTHYELVTWSLLSNFYDALVRFSPTMTLEPSLATSWEQVDVRTTRFQLRSGVRFHDGTAFGAEDVAASFRRGSRHPESGIRSYLVGIRDVRAEGDLSVVVETDTAAPTLVNRLAYLFIVPRGEEGLAKIADPIGTGPYRYAGRGDDGCVVGRAFGGWRERPEVREVTFVGIDDETERVRRFMDGDVDVAVALPDGQISEIAQTAGRRVVVQPILGVRMLVVVPRAATGTARAALEDPRVRRALLAGMDRQQLADRVYQGNATVASQYVHPVVFGYDTGLRAVPHDPQEARRLLAEAGFADGFEVEIGHGLIPEGFIPSLVENLGEIGVRLRPVELPFSDLLARAQAGKIPLMVYSRSCMSGDASEFLDGSIHTPDSSRGFGGENYHGYSSRGVDALLESAGAELDRDRRLSLLQEAQRRALVDLPVLPLVVQWEHLGVSDRIEVVTRHDGWLWAASFRHVG
jgi:peptide/nickel transport system substrate-binding protein